MSTVRLRAVNQRAAAPLSAGLDGGAAAAALYALEDDTTRIGPLFRVGAARYTDFHILASAPEWIFPTDGTVSFVSLTVDGDPLLRRLHWGEGGRLRGIGGVGYEAPAFAFVLPQAGDSVARVTAVEEATFSADGESGSASACPFTRLRTVGSALSGTWMSYAARSRRSTTQRSGFTGGMICHWNREGVGMKSWFDPRTEKRTSAIAGWGLFAREAIPGEEIVAVKGGAIIDTAALHAILEEVSPAEIQIQDDLWIAPLRAEEVEDNILCLNHSCEPNVGVRGQITFVTLREVDREEELTIDYAMIDGDPEERMRCECGHPACRALITGDDWRLPELQRRYAGNFSKYLQDRIDAMNAPTARQ